MRKGPLREELKYVLPVGDLPSIRKAIEPFTQLAPSGRGFKFATAKPVWMGRIIAEIGLMQQAASKYCTAIRLFDRRLDMKSAVLATTPAVSWSGAADIRSFS